MKKTQSCSPLVRMAAVESPVDFMLVKSLNGIINIDKCLDGTIISKTKHKDYHTAKGIPITQIYMKEYESVCPCCKRVEIVKREFKIFYTKDSLLPKFDDIIL